MNQNSTPNADKQPSEKEERPNVVKVRMTASSAGAN